MIHRCIKQRLEKCDIQLHPDKTKIIYCKDSNRIAEYKEISFDFLGYTFRPREAKYGIHNLLFTSFAPAVSKNSMKEMRAKIKRICLGRRTELGIEDISQICNPILRGWINYYGKFHLSELDSVFRHFNKRLVKWAISKYKSLKGSKMRAITFLTNLYRENPRLFVHWGLGRTGAFA